MQTPHLKTPVADILRISMFHRVVLERFLEHKRLLTRILQAEKQLESAQAEYVAAVIALLRPRALIRVIDHFADQRVNLIWLAARSADGGRDGTNTSILFPDGKTVVVEPIGAAQITELRNLEIRLEKLGGPISKEHLEPLSKLRKEYEEFVAARANAMAAAGAKRELRNLARRIWVDVYVQNQGAIKEAYPRDRRMQDLFFDDVRAPRGETPSDEAAAPEPTPTDAPKAP